MVEIGVLAWTREGGVYLMSVKLRGDGFAAGWCVSLFCIIWAVDTDRNTSEGKQSEEGRAGVVMQLRRDETEQ